MTGFAQITDPTNNLSTPINLDTQTGPVLIGSTPASTFFDNSPNQRIWRNDQVNNFELNFIQQQLVNTGRFQMAALAGFRYFRFDGKLDLRLGRLRPPVWRRRRRRRGLSRLALHEQHVRRARSVRSSTTS